MLPASQLVAKCLENNAAAQKQLYDAFAPQMMGVCYRYTRSMEEASDVLQEGFVRVFRNLQQWNGEGELGACALAAFRERVLAGITAAGRRAEIVGVYHEPALDFPSAGETYLKMALAQLS